MKLYDIVEKILRKYPQTRNSDKRLIWFVWGFKQNITEGTYLSRIHFSDYMTMLSSESVTRARRKVQENNPELRSDSATQALKDKKEGNYPLTTGKYLV